MIFTILKVIGIILLVVLALILAVVICVLFVPVKYRAVGSFDNTDIRTNAHVSWLFHLFALHIAYADETDGYIRLAFVKKRLFDDSDSEYEECKDDEEYEDDENNEKTTGTDSPADNYEALDDDEVDDAAKTQAEDKGCENTGGEPEISADENQHIKQQTKLTHKKIYKKPHKKQFKEKLRKIKPVLIS